MSENRHNGDESEYESFIKIYNHSTTTAAAFESWGCVDDDVVGEAENDWS